MEREIKILFTFVMRQIASNIFGKIIPKPLEFRKDLRVHPRKDQAGAAQAI